MAQAIRANLFASAQATTQECFLTSYVLIQSADDLERHH
ncbi:protein of unknown function [Xenorhabdus poinarii G6]|uniref:Uncharacterized protein n=1 Tax=Xenorhabdus poinarii G6 TaxID=1354304 RepID=A0A068R3Y8_9GAMM|nr:protein of unknown function [Xenorhabdus poinarii G6]